MKYLVPLIEIRMVGKMTSAVSLRCKCVCVWRGAQVIKLILIIITKNLLRIVEMNEVLCSISHIW